MISVVVLTHNEAINIERCLASVAWSDDVLVVDSGSTDGTQAMAQKMGARLMFRPMGQLRRPAQLRAGARGARHRWVLHLDADEVVTPELRDEMHGDRTRGDGLAWLPRGIAAHAGGRGSSARACIPPTRCVSACARPAFQDGGPRPARRPSALASRHAGRRPHPLQLLQGHPGLARQARRYARDEARAALRGSDAKWSDAFTLPTRWSAGACSRSSAIACRCARGTIRLRIFPASRFPRRAGRPALRIAHGPLPAGHRRQHRRLRSREGKPNN
jgi:glycosyltransferase involved in cell wall biosynthesis